MYRICPTCQKREIVVDNGCPVCLFFRSEEEQERFRQTIYLMFELEPEILVRDESEHIYRVMVMLPYIYTYKARYSQELRAFVGIVYDQIVERVTIDVEEDIEEDIEMLDDVDVKWVA